MAQRSLIAGSSPALLHKIKKYLHLNKLFIYLEVLWKDSLNGKANSDKPLTDNLG